MLKDTTIALISRGFALIFAILVTVFIARTLGPALKGTYDSLQLIVRTSTMLVVFGLGTSNVYLGARRPEKLPEFAGNSVVAALTLGFLMVLVLQLFVSIPEVNFYLEKNGISLIWIRWLVFLVPLILLQLFLQEIIRAAGYILSYALLNVFQFAFYLLLLLANLWLSENGLESAIIAWAVTQISLCALTLYLALRATQFRLRLNVNIFKESLRFGIRLYPGNIAQFLNYRLDIFLVGVFLTPADVGFYATATLLGERFWDIPTAILTALTYHVSAHPEKGANLTARTCRLIVMITTPLYIVVFIFANTAIQFVFGADYLPTVQPLLFLLPGIWVLSLGKILAIYLASSGRPIVATWSAIISLVFTFALDILLIPRIGIAGAAIASSIAYTIATLIITYVFVQDTKIPFRNLLLPQQADWQLIRQLIMGIIKRVKPNNSSG